MSIGKNVCPFLPDRILLRIPFWPFAITVLALPSLSLAICFFTAYFFRFDDVNISMCEVQNFVPSISAVTGITPQVYLWRLGIALHSTPRLCVSFIHYNHYHQRLAVVPQDRRALFLALVRLNFWLSLVENAMLICVTFVSNRENYSVHEKLFIVFMVTSLTYMLCNILCISMACHTPRTEDEERSCFWKWTLFGINITATAGLIYFYIRHRLLCEPGAFSYFSMCEYVIAYAAMAYHFTAYIDFKDMFWLVASPVLQCGGSVTENGTVDNVSQPNEATVTKLSCSHASEGTLSHLSDGVALRSRKL